MSDAEHSDDYVAPEVFALERNDTKAATALVLKLQAEKRLTPAAAEIIVMLQDDPEEIVALFESDEDEPEE